MHGGCADGVRITNSSALDIDIDICQRSRGMYSTGVLFLPTCNNTRQVSRLCVFTVRLGRYVQYIQSTSGCILSTSLEHDSASVA